MIRRTLVALFVLTVVLPTAGTAWLVAFYDEPALPPDATAIVVLSSGLTAEGTLGEQTALRVARGIDLYRAGAAPVIVMSGGQLPLQKRDMAGAMVEVALAEGVPQGALLGEARSQSTLQNAQYTRDALGDGAQGPLILVSHRYHLARAWASFHWAGLHRLTLVAADPPGRPLQEHGHGHALGDAIYDIGWEAVKWPVNIARASAARLAWALDVPPERTEKMLR